MVILSIGTFLVNFFDFNATESDIIRNHFGHFSIFLHSHQKLIQIRSFWSPGFYFRQFLTEGYGTFFTSNYVYGFFTIGYYLSVIIEQLISNSQSRCIGTMILQFHIQTENTVTVRIIQSRHNPEILYWSFRLWIKEYVTFYTADTPKILTFQIRACTPTEDF